MLIINSPYLTVYCRQMTTNVVQVTGCVFQCGYSLVHTLNVFQSLFKTSYDFIITINLVYNFTDVFKNGT